MGKRIPMPNAREDRWERMAQMRSSVFGDVFMFDNYVRGARGMVARAELHTFYQREI